MNMMRRRDLLQQLAGGLFAGAAFPKLAKGFEAASGQRSGSTGEIYLDRNENAFGASPKVLAAIQEGLGRSNRYPQRMDELKEALAVKHRVSKEQIVLGCGSSDLIRMAASSYLGPGKNLLIASPTFELAGMHASNLGAKVIRVPLKKDYSHDLEAMRTKNDAQTGLIYLCNPNNPTGSLTYRKELEAFVDKVPAGTTVFIDEAYHDYAGGSGAYQSFVDKPVQRENLIVSRTFSKVYGLAGLRIGYGVAAPPTAAKIERHHLQFAENTLALTAALAALEDHEYVATCVERNENQRQEFMNQVNARMLRALDSHGNFVCVNAMRPLEPVLEHFKKHKVFVGHRIPEMPTYLRVSLGTPEEMLEFWRIWDLQGLHPMSM